jgi:hypothetical protein
VRIIGDPGLHRKFSAIRARSPKANSRKLAYGISSPRVQPFFGDSRHRNTRLLRYASPIRGWVMPITSKPFKQTSADRRRIDVRSCQSRSRVEAGAPRKLAVTSPSRSVAVLASGIFTHTRPEHAVRRSQRVVGTSQRNHSRAEWALSRRRTASSPFRRRRLLRLSSFEI